MLKTNLKALFIAASSALAVNAGAATAEEVPVFITIGQSNADGSAFFDASEDARLNAWYSSDENHGNLKIWYRSSQIQNQASNALGEAARWTIDGSVTDVTPGWLNLWYRNENTSGRTAMNMIHNYGTYSTGTGTDCAQGRRGMEGQFGMKFAQAYPDKELYVIKLGASGSFISSWANPADNTNWTYFYEKMFKPAITDLLEQGKRPVLAGIWWMQGCADKNNSQEYYEKWLRTLIDKCHNDLGFTNGKFYIGYIPKAGESSVNPNGSASFGQSVRDAQNAVAASVDAVSIIPTSDCPMQYESAFSGYIHFNHAGQNAIADKLAADVVAEGPEKWVKFTTPGSWVRTGASAIFVPAIGSPEISYATDDNTVTATLTYPGWSETKTYTLGGSHAGPGYLDCDGTRYMTIPHSEEFDIAAGESMTISARVWLDSYGAHRGIVCNRYHEGTSNSSTTGFDIYGGYSSSNSMSNNVNLNKGSWNNLGHPWCNTLTTGQWAVVTWVLDGSAGTSRMYLDGTLKDTRTNADISRYPINPQCDILVGARYIIDDGVLSTPSKNLCWKGKITDLRFYSRALSADEVAADMEASVGPSTKDLIAAYDFKDIDRLSVTDISGNGHNGTLVGFPEYVAGSPVTIEKTVGGTVRVFNGATEVISGQNVEDGTLLTLQATPDTDCFLKEFTVNGTPISGSSFTVDGPATVSATFERDPSAPSKVLVFGMNENGSKFYRIPALCCTPKGTLIAAADKRGDKLNDLPNTISVVAKRSTDNGQTWSEMQILAQGDAASGKTYGDPAIICDRNTGTILCVFSGDTGFFTYPYGNEKPNFYYVKSTDDGLTWSEPVNFSSQIWQSGWYSAFIASGGALQTADGRIMFVANARMTTAMSTAGVYEYVVYTDDLGETWHVANTQQADGPVNGGGNESKLVETSKGLIMSIRSPGKRRFAHSTDGGVTWTKAAAVKDLSEPDCNGDIIVYPSADGQNRMLHSLPADASVRQNVSVYMSYDEGETWPVCKRLVDGYSAYSSLAVLPDGSIGCFLEEGKWDSNLPGEDGFDLYFMRFTLDWLTDGNDPGDNGDDNVYDGTLNLDGNRYMMIPNSDDFNIPAGGTMSVSVKARLENVTTQAIISNRVRNYAGNNNNDVSGWAMYTVPNATSLSFNYPGSSWTARHHNRNGHISTDEWHHFCWVYSATSSAFYIDGVQVANPPATLSGSAIPSYADILVGANYVMADYQKFSIDNLNSYVTGNIDDVRIYRDALSAADVTADMNSSAPLDGKNVIAAYDFAEIKGTDVTDISGNGHTGTLVGFPAAQGQYTVNIVAPEEGTGTLEVFDGENRVLNGRKVTEGTKLTVVATPADNYLLKGITVNGEQIETENNRGSFAISAETTVEALFERDPDAPIEYCEPTGTPGSARYVTTINISDSDNNELDIAGNGANGGFTDRTASVFVTKPGCEVKVNVTEGAGEWMHEYFYIDYGRDGVFDVDPTIALANNDLVAFNSYSADGKVTYKNSLGATVSNNQKVVNGNIPAFTIPADLPAGDYRARFRVAWCDVDPCSTLADIGNEVGKACIDFTIRIEADELETERTITVVSADARLGSVAITNPETEGNSVKTSQKNVTVEATATDIAAFMNWTDANDEIVATTPVFVYNGDSDATLTANFGHTVTLMPAQGGSATITAEGNTLKNGTIVAPGTKVTVTATPGQGMMLDCILINGAEVEMEAGSMTYTFAIEENSSIEVVFDSIRYSFSVSASEGGQVEVWESVTGSSDPAGEMINNGDMITASTEAYVFITPAEDYKIASVTVINGDDETDATDETLDWVNAKGQYIYPFYGATGNVKITVEFTAKNSINDIFAGFTDGPVEYFNLQGIKVKPENLVPGVYMIRQGSRTAKILVK